jgi:hypothetical protein
MIEADIEVKLAQAETRLIINLLRAASGLKEELFAEGPSGKAVDALIRKLEAKL